jgi:hypothetical protein
MPGQFGGGRTNLYELYREDYPLRGLFRINPFGLVHYGWVCSPRPHGNKRLPFIEMRKLI